MVKSTEILATSFLTIHSFQKSHLPCSILVEMTNLTVLVHGERKAILKDKKGDKTRPSP